MTHSMRLVHQTRISHSSTDQAAMVDSNPYFATIAGSPQYASDVSSSRTSRRKLMIWLLAFFYPVLATLCFYASWLFAWFCLGHMPRPMLDDPMQICGAMDLAYYVSTIAFVSTPVLSPLCFASSFLCPIRLTKSRSLQCLLLATIYVAFCCAISGIVSSDPGSVIEWWFD